MLKKIINKLLSITKKSLPLYLEKLYTKKHYQSETKKLTNN